MQLKYLEQYAGDERPVWLYSRLQFEFNYYLNKEYASTAIFHKYDAAWIQEFVAGIFFSPLHSIQTIAGVH